MSVKVDTRDQSNYAVYEKDNKVDTQLCGGIVIYDPKDTKQQSALRAHTIMEYVKWTVFTTPGKPIVPAVRNGKTQQLSKYSTNGNNKNSGSPETRA